MKKIIFIASLLLLSVLAIVFFIFESKNLHCETIQNAREQQICKSIEKNQEFTLVGHSTIAIGYKATFVTVKKSWCELNMNENDLVALSSLKLKLNTISSGAYSLYDLLYSQLNPNSEEAQSIYSVYSPKSPRYILQDGCK